MDSFESLKEEMEAMDMLPHPEEVTEDTEVIARTTADVKQDLTVLQTHFAQLEKDMNTATEGDYEGKTGFINRAHY